MYTEILKRNKELGFNSDLPQLQISILSNVTISQIKELIELKCKLLDGNVRVSIGDYDNIVQDSAKHNDADLIICQILQGYYLTSFQQAPSIGCVLKKIN